MNNFYYSLGLMSGTSGDGVDASLIYTDGKNDFEVISDTYEEYPGDIYSDYHSLKPKILNINDVKNHSKEIKNLGRKITLFSNIIIEKIKNKLPEKKREIDLIGFHGQTLLHDPNNKFSLQIGDGELLNQISKTKVIYNFRLNDLKNGGQGAPLTPIFHKLLIDKKKINHPISILNIGGIANITSIDNKGEISSSDIGPGNCLIDMWTRLNSNKYYDHEGNLARKGSINKIILNQSLENFYDNQISSKKSFDISDFDLSFVRGLSLEDGAATLTEFTAEICSKKIFDKNIFTCGGGRNNLFLIERLKKKIKGKIEQIDTLGINGDFVESQAFGYLAVRSYLKLPISFPETTGCNRPCTGGVLVKNF